MVAGPRDKDDACLVFFGEDWNDSSLRMRQVVEEVCVTIRQRLSPDAFGVKVRYLSLRENTPLASDLGVGGVPSLVLMRGSRVLARFHGIVWGEDLGERLLRELLR